MNKQYYLAAEFKHQAQLLFGSAMVLSVGLFVMLYSLGLLSGAAVPAIGLVLTASLAAIALSLHRLRFPEVELTGENMLLRRSTYSYMFKTVRIKWSDIEGMAVTMMQMSSRYSGAVSWKVIKLFVKSGSGTSSEVSLSLRGIERPEELLAELSGQVPPLTSEQLRSSHVMQGYTGGELSYKNFMLTPAGITRRSGLLGRETVILWKNITAFSIQGQVIAGYGAATILHRISSGKEETLVIPTGLSARYLDVLRYIVHNASNAVLDPGLVQAMRYPAGDAMRDAVSVGLLICSVAAFFPAIFFVAEYAEQRHAAAFYALLVVSIAAPFIVSVALLSARSRGRTVRSSGKVAWSLAALLGPFGTAALLLMVSPYSWGYLRGDLAVKMGDPDSADDHYSRALELVPDSPDVLFSRGILFYDEERYEQAFELFEKAYGLADDWGPRALVLIPDSLLRAGRYDEAVAWCDRILADQRGRRPMQIGRKGRGNVGAFKIEQDIQNKRREIVQRKQNRQDH